MLDSLMSPRLWVQAWFSVEVRESSLSLPIVAQPGHCRFRVWRRLAGTAGAGRFDAEKYFGFLTCLIWSPFSVVQEESKVPEIVMGEIILRL